MLTAQGVPNDVMNNFNTLIIIICVPIMNLMFYPWLRRKRIHYGPIAQITTGFFIATLGGLGIQLPAALYDTRTDIN
jgi:dipeptide/tripeptide permease